MHRIDAQHATMHQSYSEPIAMLMLTPRITVEWNHWFVSRTTTTYTLSHIHTVSWHYCNTHTVLCFLYMHITFYRTV